MRLTLGFDTAGPYVTAALFDGSGILAAAHEEMARGQAERLMPLLEEVLAEAAAQWSDVGALGVGTGPGNFTGIRISVACARGLALGLGVPAVGVSGFEALALDAGPAVTAIAAPREAVYLKWPDQAPLQTPVGEVSAPELETAQLVIGHRAEEIAAQIGGTAGSARYPRAEAIARLAHRHKNDPALPAPAPLYLKPADAAPSKETPPVILDDA